MKKNMKKSIKCSNCGKVLSGDSFPGIPIFCSENCEQDYKEDVFGEGRDVQNAYS